MRGVHQVDLNLVRFNNFNSKLINNYKVTMGNTWKGISDEDLDEAEINLLTRAGLKTEEYKLYNTQVGEDDEQQYIHCVEVPNNQQPKMVLVHGYGAGGGVFFRVIKDLSKFFHLYVVDLLGMGASGRPEFNGETTDMSEDFFVDSLKKWKENIGI